MVNVYGYLERPRFAGIVRKAVSRVGSLSKPEVYAEVCKKRRNGRVIEVVQRVVFGNPKEAMKLQGADSGGSINTAYIERLNLTIRDSLARFMHKTMNCSKILKRHTHALDFFHA